MNRGHKFVVLAVACALLLGTGCVRKKPQLPPQAKAPAEPIPAPLPAQISETAPPPPSQEAQPEPQPAPVTAAKPPKRRSRKKPPTTAASIQAATPPIASANPGNSANTTTMAMAHPPTNPAGEPAADTAIAADVSNAQLTRQKQSTAQLLEETEKTINGLKGLSQAQEETLAEIRAYVNQSRKATSEGDFERAYNLATKAHLLSDALVKK